MSMLRFDFSIVKPNINETFNDISPEQYVFRLATEKAQAILSQHTNSIVVAADTTVVFNNTILNKPIDRADARQMLTTLSGNTHQVLTGFCVADAEKMHTRVVTSNVTFRTITNNEIQAYCATGEPDDKAGAYAVQGIGSMFVAKLEGSYSGVMGLPMFELCEVLQEYGVSPLNEAVS